MKENKFYIYSHTDKHGIVRYIGKGYRQYIPFSRAHYFKKRSDEWNSVFGEERPVVNILQSDLSEEEVNKAEHYWINYYKLVKDGGTLINIVNNISFLTRKEKLQYRKAKDPHWNERKRQIHKTWKEANKEYCRLAEREYWSRPENHLRKLENMKKSYRRSIVKRREESREKYYEMRDIPGFREKMNKKDKAWRQSNPEKEKRRHKAYYESKKKEPDWLEKRKANHIHWKENNREKFNQTYRDWYKRNRERISSKRKEIYRLNLEKNKGKIIAERKSCYQENRETLLARRKEYLRINKEATNAKRRERYKMNKEKRQGCNNILIDMDAEYKPVNSVSEHYLF